MKKPASKPTRAELSETIRNLLAALEDADGNPDLLEATRELLSRESLSKVTVEVVASGINASGDALQLATVRGWNVERFAVGVERGKDFLELDAEAMGLKLDQRLPARGFVGLEVLARTCQDLLIGDKTLKFVNTTDAKKRR